MGTVGWWHWGFFGLIFLVFYVVLPARYGIRIARRAGYGGARGLLMGVPLVNVIILYVFAFSTWPIERDTFPK